VIPVEQQILADFDGHGDNLVRGDCMRACVASLWELPLAEVPHFVESETWHSDWMGWLNERGLALGSAWFAVDDDDPTVLTGSPGDLYWLATVKSPRGLTRCGVCEGAKVTEEEWVGGEHVKHEEPRPCRNCGETGLEPSLHCVVMFGRTLVYDPHSEARDGPPRLRQRRDVPCHRPCSAGPALKPIRTPDSNTVYTLPGGNEDNYLYIERTDDGELHSVWEMTAAERLLLAGGGRVQLTIIGSLVPPIILSVARPHCRACKAQETWDEAEQRYRCGACSASL